MKGTFQVIHERDGSFTGKRGRVEQRILSLLDVCDSPLLNTVDYVLNEDERAKLSGKCIGKKLELAVSDAKTGFGGRLKLEGRILAVS